MDGESTRVNGTAGTPKAGAPGTIREQVEAAAAEAWKSLVTDNADGTVSVALEAPVTLEGEPTRKLTLRKLSARDFKRLNAKRIRAGEGEAVAEAICLLAAIPPSTFDQLTGADCDMLRVVIENFLMPSRLIGEALSRISAAS